MIPPVCTHCTVGWSDLVIFYNLHILGNFDGRVRRMRSMFSFSKNHRDLKSIFCKFAETFHILQQTIAKYKIRNKNLFSLFFIFQKWANGFWSNKGKIFFCSVSYKFFAFNPLHITASIFFEFLREIWCRGTFGGETNMVERIFLLNNY